MPPASREAVRHILIKTRDKVHERKLFFWTTLEGMLALNSGTK